MRNYKIFAAVTLAVALLVPYLITAVFFNSAAPEHNGAADNGVADIEISVYRTKTQKIEKIKCRDYICAVVAGEMAADSNIEALKAQAVAAFTYTVNKMNYVNSNPDKDIGHGGAYVCDDYTHCKAYLEKDKARKSWGDKWFEKYYPNVEEAVDATLGKLVTYEGEPINAVFHAISNGKTCSAQEVWGNSVPYLKSVDCASDTLANGYESKACFTHEQFAEIFSDKLGVTLTGDYNSRIGDITYFDSGCVNEVSICGTLYSGTHIRRLFSLRSASFDVEATDTQVIFTVHGYGHGVGMSQNGAEKMANDGLNYAEILTYFYSDTKIEDYNI